MKIMDEFKEFAMRGNVIDLAIGVIMGVAFAPIVSTLVDNIIMPPIGYLLAGIDFSSLAVAIPTPTDPVLIKYGSFLNAVIKFLITAFAIFLLVKGINHMKKPKPTVAAPADADGSLLEGNSRSPREETDGRCLTNEAPRCAGAFRCSRPVTMVRRNLPPCGRS